MKVAFVLHNFPPEFAGGTEVVALAHAGALRARGVEVFVLAGSERFEPGGAVRSEGIEGIPVRRLLRDPAEVYAVRLSRPRLREVFEAEVRRARPDVVHVHHWATLTGDLVRACASLGVPAVVTLHDFWTACPRFFRTPIEGVTCPDDERRDPCVRCVREEAHLGEEALRGEFAARDADARAELETAAAVLAPSRAHATRVRSLFREPRFEVRVLPHGLLVPLGPRSEPRGDPPFRIGTFGNLTPSKGTHLLLEALAGSSVRDRVEVRVSGKVLSSEYARNLREAGRGLRFDLAGPYDPARALGEAARLDLAVFPSLCEESYGVVVDEAFAAGVPVVVSDRGALPERIGEGGRVVPGGDVTRLRAEIEGFVLDASRRARLRAGIPARVPTAADAAEILEALYAEVARG